MKKITFLFVFAVLANLIFSGIVSAQIAQRGTATTGSGTTSLTINKPTGVVSGDIMIVNIANDNNNGAASLSGWTLIDSKNPDGSVSLLYKIAGGSEPSSYAFSVAGSPSVGSIVAFSGVDNATPFDVANGAFTTGGSGTSITASSKTTVSSNVAVVMFAGTTANNASANNWSGWTTATSPGALTELYDNANGAAASVGAAWAIKASAGSTGTGSATSVTNGGWGGILIALRPGVAGPPAATLTPSATQNILVGGSVNFTATASNYAGSGNYTYTWNAAGATIPGSNPNTIAAASDSKSLTYAVAGTYTVNVTIARSGAGTLTTNTTTVVVTTAPASPNLWASSSSGTQISSYTVANGIYIAGPTNLFAPTFPGTTTGGTTTAAIGRNAQGGVANGYFYWLPNTSGNSGVVEVFAATATGLTPTRIGSFDVNGASNNSLGFVRLGMAGDGTGWILAGDGTTLYLASFLSNGVNAVTITTKPVSLVGGAPATFQNGDVCVSGNNNMYALANDGAGVTQIFIGSLSNPTVTLTKKWDLVDPSNVPFTGSVNGVAFDAVGSLYITTAAGLYFIDQATVNGPAGTVQCALVQAQTGLQDLASNVFPTQSTLPVNLTDFSVTKSGSNALLNWKTSFESNTDHFEIERSYDGVNFNAIGSKQAAGNSSTDVYYQFIDPISLSSGNIYYRLKTLDMDAKSSYSKIVVLRLNGGNVKNFTVYPNPFTNNLKVEINSDKETAVTIRISNALGQPVINRNVILQKGVNVVVLSSELQSLKPGMHLMEIISEDGKMTQKIIKR